MTVEANDAARWLDGRRGFLKTVQMRSLKDLPEEPTADEFKRILVARIQDMVPDTRLIPSSITAGQGLQYEVGMRASTLAQALGWPVERARPWVAGEVGALDPEDCNGIAKATGLDAGWLTLQVVRVRFPEAARHLQPTPELVRSTGTFAAGPMSIDVTLTEAGIRNGYFDIEQRQARRFFPDDAFGGRGSDETGRDIVLHVDGRTESTDIRVKSKALVSPRRRFSAYFKSQKAVPGDVIRITRTGDRAYQVTFIGK